MASRSDGGHADGSGNSSAGISSEAGVGGEGGARGAGAAGAEGLGAAGREGKGVAGGLGGGRGGEDVSTRVVMNVLKVSVLVFRPDTPWSELVHCDGPVCSEWRIGIAIVVPVIFCWFSSVVKCERTFCDESLAGG